MSVNPGMKQQPSLPSSPLSRCHSAVATQKFCAKGLVTALTYDDIVRYQTEKVTGVG